MSISYFSKTRSLFVAACLFFLQPAHCQTPIPGNGPCPCDILQKYALQDAGCVGHGETGKNAVWNFFGMRTTENPTLQSFRMSNDSVPRVVSTERGNMRYLIVGEECIRDAGFENNTIKVLHDIQPMTLMLPLEYGGRSEGLFHGKVEYCDKLKLLTFVTWQLACDAEGSLTLPDGDTLCGVVRVHTSRTIYCTPFDADEPQAEASPSEERIRSLMSAGCPYATIDEFKWYSPQFRYPVVEISEYRHSGQGNPIVSAYYIPVDRQLELAGSDLYRNAGNADGERRADGAHGSEFKYTISNNQNAENITVHYVGSERAYDVTVILADISGIVYQSRSQKGMSEGEITIDCSGLRRGQYVVYVKNGVDVYTEKISRM